MLIDCAECKLQRDSRFFCDACFLRSFRFSWACGAALLPGCCKREQWQRRLCSGGDTITVSDGPSDRSFCHHFVGGVDPPKSLTATEGSSACCQRDKHCHQLLLILLRQVERLSAQPLDCGLEIGWVCVRQRSPQFIALWGLLRSFMGNSNTRKCSWMVLPSHLYALISPSPSPALLGYHLYACTVFTQVISNMEFSVISARGKKNTIKFLIKRSENMHLKATFTLSFVGRVLRMKTTLKQKPSGPDASNWREGQTCSGTICCEWGLKFQASLFANMIEVSSQT